MGFFIIIQQLTPNFCKSGIAVFLFNARFTFLIVKVIELFMFLLIANFPKVS